MKRVISAILFSIITSFAFAAVLYVDNNTSDGTWLGAYEKLEVALNDADYGDDIWVAAGIYYPTESSNRNNTFIISDGISLYGGFKGGETSLSQRDYINNVVVLDGNIGKSDSRTDNV